MKYCCFIWILHWKFVLFILKTGTVYVPAVLELDLGVLKSIPSKCKTAIDIYGQIDILINCAGISHRGTVMETELDVDQKIMNVNYFGSLAITRGNKWNSHLLCSYLLNID